MKNITYQKRAMLKVHHCKTAEGQKYFEIDKRTAHHEQGNSSKMNRLFFRDSGDRRQLDNIKC